MYREAGARRRVYFNPQTTIYESTVVQCMLVNQCLWSFTMEKVKVATAAKFSVELLNLSVKTQEKDFYSIYTILVLKHMKGTEVPNPRRSSACDCTCVLTRIDHYSLMLAIRILFCSCLCKVRSRISDALSQALCNLSLAFLADLTLSDLLLSYIS